MTKEDLTRYIQVKHWIDGKLQESKRFYYQISIDGSVKPPEDTVTEYVRSLYDAKMDRLALASGFKSHKDQYLSYKPGKEHPFYSHDLILYTDRAFIMMRDDKSIPKLKVSISRIESNSNS